MLVSEIEMREVQEQSRTYIFPNNERIQVENVVEFGMRKDGTTHRLKAKNSDGSFYFVIVSPGWLMIKIEGIERMRF